MSKRRWEIRQTKRKLGAVEQFMYTNRTAPFIAPQHMTELYDSLQTPRPVQLGTRGIPGTPRAVRVFASNYVPEQDDFNRRVVQLGMGRRHGGAS